MTWLAVRGALGSIEMSFMDGVLNESFILNVESFKLMALPGLACMLLIKNATIKSFLIILFYIPVLRPAILRLDCYRRAVLDGGVDFFDFVVRDGDAAGGPVFPLVPKFKEECGNLVRVAVDHDVAAGLVVAFFRGLDLLRIRVRNLQR